MNHTQPLYENYLDLLIAVIKRAVRDARRGDKGAARFLQYFGAPVPNRRNVKGI